MNMSWNALQWILALGVCVSIFLWYLRSFHRRNLADKTRLAESESLGFVQATGQYPHIDPALCMGCGACVSVCPEGDVLGLVGGQAVVVNGVRCVGISLCQEACPVDAIEVGIGDVKGRKDIPLLTDANESVVPGLFIAGELGGLSLVRNAIFQGQSVVRHIHGRMESGEFPRQTSASENVHDLLVIGAGPAGLSAALAATEVGLDYVVLEQQDDFGGTIFNYPRRKIVHTQPVDLPLHGVLDASEYSKEDLLKLFEGLREKHSLRFAFGHRVLDVRAEKGHFVVDTAEGSFRSLTVLLAIGRRGTPRKLGVEGEELSKVAYEVRDAAEYEGKNILIVGGGDSAVEAAMGLANQASNVVTLSYRKDRFARIKKRNQDKLEDAITRGQVKTILTSNVTRIEAGSVHLAQDECELNLANDYVFVFVGSLPPYPLLEKIGVRFGGSNQ